jgi:hypothetical protein
LIQKLNNILSDPRRCPMRACRRHQRCTASDTASARKCLGIKNRKPVSKEAGEATLADIARELKRRSAAFSEKED